MPENDLTTVEWKLHLASPPERVYTVISSDRGRESFWAESATEGDGGIHFEFPNGTTLQSEVLESTPTERFVIEYFSGTATFALEPAGHHGTDLTLRHEELDPSEYQDTAAGWVSVLLSLKAAVDHGIDLRNHDPTRTWDDGFVDN